MMYLFGYGIGRFIIESFRTDQLLLPYIGLPNITGAFSLPGCIRPDRDDLQTKPVKEEHTQELIEYNTIKKYCQVGVIP